MDADQALVQRLRSLFAEELQDGLQVLVDGLLVLERDAATAAGSQLVRELFRAAHSLKGAAHAASVPEAVQACDRLESALAAVRDHQLVPDTELVTTLLSYTDTLATVAAGLAPEAAEPAVARPPAPAEPALREAPPLPAAAAEPAAAASLRVDTDKVDRVLREAGATISASQALHELAGQAATAAEQLAAATSSARSMATQASAPALLAQLDDAARAAAALARAAEVTDRALHQASTGVTAAVQQLRTQPFSHACSSLERVVRDIAADSGRSARFRLSGGEVDVDRSVVAALRDPLLHLVRNAVDHGVEKPDVRVAAGKPATATVEVSASVVGSLLNVVVRDDGAGIDTAALREAAAARGMTVPDRDEELALVPGLSSRPSVTAVSGRGVGMDAARATLEQLGGSLRVASRPGSGTEVHLTCPVTLAVMRVLLVQAAAQVLGLPTSSVERVAGVPRQELRHVDGEALLTLRGRTLRAVSLAAAVGATAEASADAAALLSVVIPREGDCALITDGLLDELEVAVQPVPARLAGAPGVLGMSVARGQLPLLVINPVAVGRAGTAFRLPAQATAAGATARILLAEDTVTTRALERSILESAGYTVAVAVDGADAWEQLQADGADLVVSDVDMPRMSGIELCRRIRGAAHLRDTPVVLVTSLDSVADRQRGLEAGADAYVVKAELQQGSLLDAIARLL